MIIVALFIFGLILGSFANALVWRIHGQEDIREKIDELKEKKASKARDKKIRELEEQLVPLSMSRGRSMCSQCHHPLAGKDLVPLFSWLYLRGKCRYCRQPIQDPPLMEAGLAAAFVASYTVWPLSFAGYGLLAFIVWLICLTGFAALTLYDLRWYVLPDRIVWPLVGIVALQVLLHVTVFDGGVDSLLNAFWGIVIASGIFYVLYQVSKGEWIGGGDVKLGLVLGLLVGGPLPALLLIFIASLLGTLASLPMLLRRKLKRTSVIPFGPFLMAGAVIMVLFGERIVDLLMQLVLV
jgi:prepilin signal peptidase PulO-like enzyme (type II secretory pathway)